MAIFIGDVVRLNAQDRRAGLIDQLLECPLSNVESVVPVDEPISGSGFTIVKASLDIAQGRR